MAEDDQLYLLDGVTTNLGAFNVGSTGTNNVLIATNAAVVSAAPFEVGNGAGANDNSALFTGSGTLLNAAGSHVMSGRAGSRNEILILDGAGVTTAVTYISHAGASGSNSLVVSGAGSHYYQTGIQFYFGQAGSSNYVEVSDGAMMRIGELRMGDGAGASNNLFLATGVGTVVTTINRTYVGISGGGNLIRIEDGAKYYSTEDLWFGFQNASSPSNTLIVSGAGSEFITPAHVWISERVTHHNSLIVSNGGYFQSANLDVGYYQTHGNQLIVTGAGSVLSNAGTLYVGRFEANSNTLSVLDGGKVYTANLGVGGNGFGAKMSNNVHVSGAGSLLQASETIRVGQQSEKDLLKIDLGGTVVATAMYLGNNAYTFDSAVTVQDVGSRLFVTNSAGTALFSVEKGHFNMNGGSAVIDSLSVIVGGRVYHDAGDIVLKTASVNNGFVYEVGNGTDKARLHVDSLNVASFVNGLTVNSNAVLTFGNTLSVGTAGLTMNAGAGFGGTGTLVGDFTYAAGATVAPGASPGTFTQEGDVVFGAGGNYDWEINSFGGTSGGTTGWDMFQIDGALNVTATAMDQFNINLHSLTSDNQSGLLPGFDPNADYLALKILEATSITGFDAAKFNLNAAGFLGGTGSWEIYQSGNSLYLNYIMPIPEPSTCAFMLAAGVLFLCRGCFRRRQSVAP
ncbi:hypothetical protein QQ056_05375 [Oscillatoria laete-virens NRMC-F 0139]|nr:hypothetical protein [Oscillatoria laete-virens]MDL5052984.1 hypothetical protein [Oscillatoria laete-virens NRMC-F 0139]